jgi:hypothetical protein
MEGPWGSQMWWGFGGNSELHPHGAAVKSVDWALDEGSDSVCFVPCCIPGLPRVLGTQWGSVSICWRNKWINE